MFTQKKGFTLIELIVVVALASILIAAAASIFPLITNINGTANDISTAQTLARTKLLMIESQLRYANTLNIEGGAPSSPKSDFNYMYVNDGKITLRSDAGITAALTSDKGFESYDYTILFSRVNSKVIRVTITVLSKEKSLFSVDTEFFVSNLMSQSITGLDAGSSVSYQLAGNPVTAISVTSPTSIIGIWGYTLQMKSTIYPSNASKKGVAWSVDKTDLASITQTGLLTPLKTGIVTVKATALDGSAVYGTKQIIILSEVITITDVTLSTSTGAGTLQKGGNSIQMVATITPLNASYQTLTWSVDNTDYATISSSGILTSKSISNKSVMVTASTNDGSRITASAEILLID